MKILSNHYISVFAKILYFYESRFFLLFFLTCISYIQHKISRKKTCQICRITVLQEIMCSKRNTPPLMHARHCRTYGMCCKLIAIHTQAYYVLPYHIICNNATRRCIGCNLYGSMNFKRHQIIGKIKSKLNRVIR